MSPRPRTAEYLISATGSSKPTGMYCYYGDPDSPDEDNDASNYDFHSSQSSCEGDGEDGGGQWINDDETHQTEDGDWVDNDGRPEDYASGTYKPIQTTTAYVTGLAVDATLTLSAGIADVALYVNNGVAQAAGTRQVPILRLFGSHWCGSGGGGKPNGAVDEACKAHDECYDAAGLSANVNTSSINLTPAQTQAAKDCNQALYNAVRSHPGAPGSSGIQLWLTKGANTPFGSYLAPGTAVKAW